jgi:hypothetical protein
MHIEKLISNSSPAVVDWTGESDGKEGDESVLAGAGSSASSVFTAMAGGTGISETPLVSGSIRVN